MAKLDKNKGRIKGCGLSRYLQLKSELAGKDRELSEQVHFLQTLIDVIPAPIFYKDANGKYKGCNKSFEEYIGLKKEKIVGSSVYDLAPGSLAEIYQKKDNELLEQTGIQIYENRVMYADGSEHDVIFNKATFTDTSMNIAGIVGVITDITEPKKAERALQESSEKLKIILGQTVQAMSSIAEIRDMYTAGHQKRVSELAVGIAIEMGLDNESVTAIQVAGMLHDIGKIAVPAEILTKPGKLSVHEFGIVRNHSNIGYEILKTIDFPWPVADIVHQHHERIDGSGYPNGLKSSEMLLEAKIVAVADVVEAMSSHRPYRPSLGVVQAITEINLNRGILYDDSVVKACITLFEKGFSYKS
ncbi:HD-GYP domain-containing protein [Dendrosporobacter sp. 1207_IL3150]|uniref:HD-GYP domain-containing protein n=1 Tax=Dendrosporobacter sp. 1207_IL3150 TaxID=3084054 RepID=UPI002FD8A64A